MYVHTIDACSTFIIVILHSFMYDLSHMKFDHLQRSLVLLYYSFVNLFLVLQPIIEYCNLPCKINKGQIDNVFALVERTLTYQLS